MKGWRPPERWSDERWGRRQEVVCSAALRGGSTPFTSDDLVRGGLMEGVQQRAGEPADVETRTQYGSGLSLYVSGCRFQAL